MWRYLQKTLIKRRKKSLQYVEKPYYNTLIINVLCSWSKNLDWLYCTSDKGWRRQVKHFWSSRERNQIGLRSPDASNGPRIHDIRHRFAIKTLLNWYRKGLDINQKISLLTTYLGHKKTKWYLLVYYRYSWTTCSSNNSIWKKIGEQKWKPIMIFQY